MTIYLFLILDKMCILVNYLIFTCSLFRDLVIETYLQLFKFAIHDTFFCKLHTCTYFTRMLNSQGIKYANISESTVLANNITARDKIREY